MKSSRYVAVQNMPVCAENECVGCDMHILKEKL